MEMSLHRIIAEIKAIEAKLATVQAVAFVGIVVGTDDAKTAEIKATSQSNFDRVNSQIANLAMLKAARNKLNSVTKITIASKVMTIDEALAAKAALPHKQAVIQSMQQQFVGLQRQVDQNQVQIDAKVQQQIQTMFAGTRKATDEEIATIRRAVEGSQKQTLVFTDGLKEKLEKMKEEVEAFVTEADFVLSEANATTKAEINLV